MNGSGKTRNTNGKRENKIAGKLTGKEQFLRKAGIGMKKKIEVKSPDDIEKLKKEEQEKWEIALELGLFDKVVDSGWRSLTAKESGRIGGILSSRKGKVKK